MAVGKILIDDDEIEKKFYVRSGILAQLPPPYRQLHILERIKGYSKEMHSHNFYQIIIVTSGMLEVLTPDKEFSIKSGEAVIIAPGSQHALYSPEGYSQLGIDIYNQSDSRGLVSLLRKTFPDGTAVEFTISPIKIDTLYKNIFMQIDINTLKLMNKAESLILEIIEQASDLNIDFSERFLTAVSDVGYLMNLEEISRKMNMSVTHLERMTKKYFGCSTKAFCQRIRLSKSGILLENTTLPIKSISEKLGFYDESHYVKAFRKMFGITPSQYRQNSMIEKHKP